MNIDRKTLEKMVDHALSGKGAHVEAEDVFAGLDWKITGTCPEGVPHSLFQLLNHMIYWQDWAVRWLDGEKPPLPKHASGSWPGDPEPASAGEWKRTVQNFRNGLAALGRRSRSVDLLARPGKKTGLEMLQTIASHNSYHLGQAVFLRQLLGAWPPPSGGLTW
ncbi:MAG: DinB family protein [Acidobacteriia bacterium]|nr:DinB family protein [Terriglobia bacterium]